MIEEVRGKQGDFTDDSGHFYKFVTKPGPFNFVGDENATPCKSKKSSKSAAPASSLGKRKRRNNDETAMEYDGTWFSNEHASTSCDEESFLSQTTPVRDMETSGGMKGAKFNDMWGSAEQATPGRGKEPSGGMKGAKFNVMWGSAEQNASEVSPAKRCRKEDGSVSGVGAWEESSKVELETDPTMLAKVWKELTLNR